MISLDTEILIIQENTLGKLAVVLRLLEQHEPLVLIRGLSKTGIPCLGAHFPTKLFWKTLLEAHSVLCV